MKDSDSLRQLRSELENDFRFVERCGKEVKTFSERWDFSPEDEMAAIAAAYGLHNLYGAFEGYFLRISKHFENHLPPQNWHSELVEKMTLNIPGIRPALFDEAYLAEVDELRRFRHVFRNLYKGRLNPEKVRLVLKICQNTVARFEPLHTRFQSWLKDLIDKEGDA